ncbi:hypothetical protein GGP41_010741 [Bipolaris sorokiniana]|uniref:Protein kinase domain-containing protein n=1 Tax=Cochliobolus sativus TaxID=45130 RepID=A0A8H5ZMU8_COCSA|nr:hypothetical protein GGP41_010741 [Bipolaris sorokiniana]
MRDSQGKPTETRRLSSQSVQRPKKVLSTHHESDSARKEPLRTAVSADSQQLSNQSSEHTTEIPHTHHVNKPESKDPPYAAVHAEVRQLSQHLVQPPTEVLDIRNNSKPTSIETLHKRIPARERQSSQQSVQQPTMFQDVQHVRKPRCKETLPTEFPAEALAASTKSLADVIQQVSLLLIQVNLQWSKVPRTYIVLRTINCLDLLDRFIDLGFSDHWFLTNQRGLPSCLVPSKRSQIVTTQDLVMIKSMDLEKGEEGWHYFFREHKTLPLEMKGILGTGKFGQVDRLQRVRAEASATERCVYTDALIKQLKEMGNPADNAALAWTQDMIMVQQQLRPNAASLMASILGKSQTGSGSEVFWGICCTSQHDDLSDFDELEIDDTK